MLKNEFKKFEGTPAIRMRNEEDFLGKLQAHCNSNQPFLFGSDSCNVVTRFFHACRDSVSDSALREKFLLIAADTSYRVSDATAEFRDRFVFYSPKITFGVDFSIETPQDVFIYIAGNSIQPSGSYQQATRCRNIRSLFYYGEVHQQDCHYRDLEDVRSSVAEAVQTSRSCNSACTYLDEHDHIQVVKNTFFTLYCHNEFIRDIYDSNKIRHVELILRERLCHLSRGDPHPSRQGEQEGSQSAFRGTQ